jgi:hypothetical protein
MKGNSAACKAATNLAAFRRLVPLNASRGVRGVQKSKKDVPGDPSRGADPLRLRMKEHDA